LENLAEILITGNGQGIPVTFQFFAYTRAPTVKPAAYATENVPLKPKYFLPVSVKGLKDGDYAMIYGYPGSTNRYETSYGVKLKTDIENPATVELRDMRLKHMFAQMKNDPATKLKLASSYASIANYWKFFDGETKQLLKYKVYEQKQAQEKAFLDWAKGKSDYEGIFNNWAKDYDQWRPYAKHRIYINEGILGTPLLAFASSLMTLESDIVKKGVDHADVKKGLEMAEKYRSSFLKNENIPSDKNILTDVLKMFYENIDKNQHPIGFYESIRSQFGDLKTDPHTKNTQLTYLAQRCCLMTINGKLLSAGQMR
jgi:hypothetical protein